MAAQKAVEMFPTVAAAGAPLIRYSNKMVAAQKAGRESPAAVKAGTPRLRYNKKMAASVDEVVATALRAHSWATDTSEELQEKLTVVKVALRLAIASPAVRTD